ncbi:MAG: DUF6261 family protein [Tannerellaceae bacterium]|jgi:hypothetical protein|nr:DUF6261 family protein [Tannerellaceae bacterium]
MLKINIHLRILERLRNAEHYDLMNRIIANVEGISMKPASLLPMWNAFKEAFERENLVFRWAARVRETDAIVAAHKKRKATYMAIKYLIEAASYGIIPSAKEAADSLLRMMEKYKRANYIPMNEASALYTNLIEEFADERYAAKVALIPTADAAIVRLDRENETFKNLYAIRSLGEEEMKIKGTMQEARKATNRTFIVWAEALNALYLINEVQADKDMEMSATLYNMIMGVDAYLHRHETIYARRNPKAPAAFTEEDNALRRDEDASAPEKFYTQSF